MLPELKNIRRGMSLDGEVEVMGIARTVPGWAEGENPYIWGNVLIMDVAKSGALKGYTYR